MPDGEVARLLDELMAAGVIELLSTGAHRMSALSKRYYLFTEPAGSAGLADGEADI